MKTRIFLGRISLLVFLAALVCPLSGGAEDEIDCKVTDCYGREQELQVVRAPLWRILDLVRRECSVDVYGLEQRKTEEVVFVSGCQTLQKELKRLFRQLGEANFAFEFHRGRLARVLLFPRSGAAPSDFPVAKGHEMVKGKIGNVVRVKQVVADSQAEALGIEEGDLIIWYDGEIVTGCIELLAAVEKKSNKEEVEIIVVKDHFPLRFLLKGGNIGVGMKTVSISEKDLDSYLTIAVGQL